MNNKEKLLKKYKLIFFIEYIVIALVLLVIGLLRLFDVMQPDATRQTIFNWITIFGGSWVTIDFIWTLLSKKKREKSSLLDKTLNLPAGLYVVTYDILCFADLIDITQTKYFVGALFIYIFVSYLIQGIYHWYHPLKAIEEAVDEELAELAKKASQEETKTSDKQD